MAGRKHKPIELRVLRMSSMKAERLLKKKTPTPGPLVDPPAWLTDDQKAGWKYAIDNAPRNVLRGIDKSVLAAFVIAEDTHRKASSALNASQLLVKTPTQGLPQQNPYLPIVNRQMTLMIRAASELGFTPCSRARIDAGNPSGPAVGDWEDLATG